VRLQPHRGPSPGPHTQILGNFQLYAPPKILESLALRLLAERLRLRSHHGLGPGRRPLNPSYFLAACLWLQIACGCDHTMVLAQDGTLFTFGSNSLAQLGRPSPPGGEHVQPRDAGAWLVNPEASCGSGMRFLRVGRRDVGEGLASISAFVSGFVASLTLLLCRPGVRPLLWHGIWCAAFLLPLSASGMWLLWVGRRSGQHPGVSKSGHDGGLQPPL
jgi:hypothetical protein